MSNQVCFVRITWLYLHSCIVGAGREAFGSESKLGQVMTTSSRQTIPYDTCLTIFKAKLKLLLVMHDTRHAHPRVNNHCPKQEPLEFFYAWSWGPLSLCSSQEREKDPCSVTGREREDLTASGRRRCHQGVGEEQSWRPAAEERQRQAHEWGVALAGV
jgi:hypothetical protein